MLTRDPFFGRQPVTPQPAGTTGTPGTTAQPVTHATPAHAHDVASRDNVRNAPKGAAVNSDAQGSQLIVGRNIRMKGVEITDCDTLVVEGHVEATMDSRMIQIAPDGTFAGTVGIDIAEISGAFSGELTVRKCLTIHATGKVSGKIRYHKVVIEEGGEISGEITRLREDDKSPRIPAAAPANKPGAAPATALIS
jgi:cytoskeletal protein CcmA (bactofilin family)